MKTQEMNNTETEAVSDLRQFLQTSLLSRIKKNPAYSLRSFARSIGVDAGVLSRFFSGKRGLSEKTFVKIMKRLNVNPQVMAQLKTSRRKGGEVLAPAFSTLTTDRFQVMSDWYHYAILELTHLKGFQPKALWVARRLGISATEVNVAIQRLKQLGLLEILPNGHWVDRCNYLTNIEDPHSSSARRIHQKQVLEMAIEALEEISPENRDHTSLTFAVNSKKLKQARELTKKFRYELLQLMQGGQIRDEVFHLSVSLYPVTKKRKEK